MLGQTDLSGAIQYCLNQWEKLERFTLDGRLSLDNNRAERSIKPFVNGLVPYDYVVYLLDALTVSVVNITHSRR